MRKKVTDTHRHSDAQEHTETDIFIARGEILQICLIKVSINKREGFVLRRSNSAAVEFFIAK